MGKEIETVDTILTKHNLLLEYIDVEGQRSIKVEVYTISTSKSFNKSN
jgi:hypothetical protein